MMADARRPLAHDEVADLAPAFVLGALEPEEAAALRAHLASCPEPHPEIQRFGAVVPALLESVEVVEPPASLRARILDTAAAVRGDDRGVAAVREAATRARGSTLVRGPASWFRQPAWIAAGLAAVLLVALGARTIQVQAEVDALRAYRDGVAAVLDAAASSGSQVAVLTSPEGAGPAGLAAVGADGRIAIVMRDLAPTRGAEVYEAWLIGEDGAPVPAGSFTVGSAGTATAVLTRSAAGATGVIVALTREPGPGATTPTLPIVALGTARPVAGRG